MDGLKLLMEAERAGLVVSASGDVLIIRGPRKAEPLARKLIANKAQVLPYLSSDLPADVHVLWDERAAILEYDGGVPREIAEHLALIEVLNQMKTAAEPHNVKEQP
jgi:hypothetical protein